jgi:peroxidase
MRSLPGQQQLGPREQVNQNTAFLDGSVVYGENICVARQLKGFNGRLNSTVHPVRGKELLPRSDSHPECKSPSGYCFIAGMWSSLYDSMFVLIFDDVQVTVEHRNNPD